MNAEERRRRGEKARKLLDDQLINSALHDIRQKMYSGISSTSLKQDKEREGYYYMLKAIDSFESMLKNYISEGNRALESMKLKAIVVKRVQEL